MDDDRPGRLRRLTAAAGRRPLVGARRARALGAASVVAAALGLGGASGDVTAVELERRLEQGPMVTRVDCIGRRERGYACRVHLRNGAPTWAIFTRGAEGALRRVA